MTDKTAGDEEEDAATRELEGVAYLCLSRKGLGFQGRFISKSRTQLGLVGHLEDHGHCSSGVHECCLDEESVVYALTVVDYDDFNSEHVLHSVLASGGDNISLTSDQVEFYTDELLVGQRAEECIKKYFSEQLSNDKYFVCIGEMRLKIPLT